jgi:hypothetical protein
MKQHAKYILLIALGWIYAAANARPRPRVRRYSAIDG